jgi:hypothetical protein
MTKDFTVEKQRRRLEKKLSRKGAKDSYSCQARRRSANRTPN